LPPTACGPILLVIMIIDIVSDAICPWCYIGKRRLERALAMAPQPDLQIGWRPFQLNPDMPLEGMDRQEYLRLKFGDRAGGRMYQAVEEAGRAEGIPFNFDRIRRTPNTLLVHRLIRYAAREGHQDDVVEAAFRAYFVEGEDIGQVDTLVRLTEGIGMDGARVRAYLESDEDLAQIKAEDQFARSDRHPGRALLHHRPQVRAFRCAAARSLSRGLRARPSGGREHDNRHRHRVASAWEHAGPGSGWLTTLVPSAMIGAGQIRPPGHGIRAGVFVSGVRFLPHRPDQAT